MNLLILFVYFIVTVFLQYFNMCNIRMFWFLVAQSVCDAIHTVFCHFSEVLPLCFLLIDNLKAPPSVSGWVTRTFYSLTHHRPCCFTDRWFLSYFFLSWHPLTPWHSLHCLCVVLLQENFIIKLIWYFTIFQNIAKSIHWLLTLIILMKLFYQ